jgi:hypothetical protein
MTFGASVALAALGAILAFAVQDNIGGLDVSVVGWILMAAGALGIILGLAAMNRTRSGLSSTSRRTVVDGNQPPREEVIEQDIR